MNAPVRIAEARPLLSVVEILKILAESGAASWALFPLELPDVVDPLQYFAEGTGLIAALGEDKVQLLMSEPFARQRKEVRR